MFFRYLLLNPTCDLDVYRSGGDTAPAEGSTCGDFGALVKDACDVCDARVSQEHDGRRAAKRQTDDNRESNSQPTPLVTGSVVPSISSFLFLVLMDQSDHSAHGNDGATMELPSRAADDEASVRRWHGREEGMEARGLGDVHFVLVRVA